MKKYKSYTNKDNYKNTSLISMNKAHSLSIKLWIVSKWDTINSQLTIIEVHSQDNVMEKYE